LCFGRQAILAPSTGVVTAVVMRMAMLMVMVMIM
jgi:hypothetical protein